MNDYCTFLARGNRMEHVLSLNRLLVCDQGLARIDVLPYGYVDGLDHAEGHAVFVRDQVLEWAPRRTHEAGRLIAS